MAYPFSLSFYLSNVVGGEASPNSVAPSAARIFQAPGSPDESYSAALVVEDGTSLAVTLWFFDPTSNTWLAVGSPVTLLAGAIAYVAVPPAASLFAQLGANTGGVTKFGVGFIPGNRVDTTIVVGTSAPAAPVTALHDGTTFTVPTVTATAVSTATAWTYGVWVQADLANTDTVVVRGAVGGTTAGRVLAPGDSWDLGLQDLSKVFAVSTSAGQKLRIGGLS